MYKKHCHTVIVLTQKVSDYPVTLRNDLSGKGLWGAGEFRLTSNKLYLYKIYIFFTLFT